MPLARIEGIGTLPDSRLRSCFLRGMTLEKTTAYARIARLQVTVGILGLLALMAFGQAGYGFAFIYGVALMMVNGWWLAKRLEKTKGLDVQAGQRSLLAGAALRFAALIAGLALGFLIGLHLLAVAAGMFVAQVVVFFSALKEFKRDKGEGLG